MFFLSYHTSYRKLLTKKNTGKRFKMLHQFGNLNVVSIVSNVMDICSFVGSFTHLWSYFKFIELNLESAYKN